MYRWVYNCGAKQTRLNRIKKSICMRNLKGHRRRLYSVYCTASNVQLGNVVILTGFLFFVALVLRSLYLKYKVPRVPCALNPLMVPPGHVIRH